jgi:nicotinamide riboside transporter PnuC
MGFLLLIIGCIAQPILNFKSFLGHMTSTALGLFCVWLMRDYLISVIVFSIIVFVIVAYLCRHKSSALMGVYAIVLGGLFLIFSDSKSGGQPVSVLQQQINDLQKISENERVGASGDFKGQDVHAGLLLWDNATPWEIAFQVLERPQ